MDMYIYIVINWPYRFFVKQGCQGWVGFCYVYIAES